MAIGIRILKFVVIWARGLFFGALLLFCVFLAAELF